MNSRTRHFLALAAMLGFVNSVLAANSGFTNAVLPISFSACAPKIPTPAGTPATVLANPDPSPTAANSLKVSLVEGFAGVFSSLVNSDNGGLGVQGIRFRIELTDIPTGIVVYAPQGVSSGSFPTTGSVQGGGATTELLMIKGAASDGSGGAPVGGPVGNQFDLITPSGGTATIIYEVAFPSSGTSAETVTLFLAFTGTLTAGSGAINASLGLVPVGPPTINPALPQFTSTSGATTVAIVTPCGQALPALPASPSILLGSDKLAFIVPLGSDPEPYSLPVLIAARSPLNWTAAITSITGGNWLRLSPVSGRGSSKVTVTVSSRSLPIGSYSATVTFSAPETTNKQFLLTVVLDVTAVLLSLAPSSLDFRGASGTNLPSQQLTISTNAGIVNWTATAQTTSGGNWLSITPSSGVTPATATVSVNSGGLADGAYQGTISVSAVGGSNSPQVANVTLIVGTPIIALKPTSLFFTASVGKNPPSQTFEVQNGGAGVLGWTATVATQSGGDWLAVSPTTAVAPSTITVTVNSSGLAAGTYVGTVRIAALPGVGASNSPQTLTVSLAVDVPTIALNGLQNAASYSTETPVSPGSIVSLFGVNLAKTTPPRASVPLPTTLGDTQVLVNGLPAPLFYVSPTQINFQIPWELAAQTQASLTVTTGGLTSSAQTIKLAGSAPGIFSVDSTGKGQGAILIASTAEVAAPSGSIPGIAARPVRRGEFVTIYCTGLGPVGNRPPTGAAAQRNPLSETTALPVVTIGGIAARVLFSGLAPDSVGLYQVNAEVPANAPTGSAVAVLLSIGGATSNAVTIAVQ